MKSTSHGAENFLKICDWNENSLSIFTMVGAEKHGNEVIQR